MGRKKAGEAEKINIIKEATKSSGVSPRLISLWLDVKYTTVSSWNSNTSQPNEENLNEIGELLEKDNRLLLVPDNRISTGLCQALEKELKRLHTEQNLPYEIKQKNEETGKEVSVNNPVLMQLLKDFADKYKKENSVKIYPLYFDKTIEKLTNKEIKNLNQFICLGDENDKFKFLVINKEDAELIPLAGFTNLDDAQDYLNYQTSF